MPAKRKALHNRSINVQGFIRDDGLWEVEGRLVDTKTYGFTLPDRGLIDVGEALHDLELRIAVDDDLKIIEISAHMPGTPYNDCSLAEKSYQSLVGLQIKSGWMDEVKARFARNQACTHITEMLPVMATNLIQTMRGYRMSNNKDAKVNGDEIKLFRDTCYGLRAGGRADQQQWQKK